MKSKLISLVRKVLHNQAAVYLSNFLFSHYSHSLKSKRTIYCLTNTFQPPAFVYDISPSSLPPSVVHRAWCLKTTESNAQPKYFQVT